MATWMTHLRIADKFIELIDECVFNLPEFVVGNIAPDCGIPNSDGLTYNPDKDVTHFGYTENRDYKKFKKKYLDKKLDDKSPFLFLGYYMHLLVDEEWGRQIAGPEIKRLMTIIPDEKTVSDLLKSDWYDLDKLYIKNNPDMRAFNIFVSIKSFPNRYFDFFPENAFELQINRIREFYLTPAENYQRKYTYLTEKELENFIESTVVKIKPKIDEIIFDGLI